MSESTANATPVTGSCHCGAITVTVSRKPYTTINDCQCSICRRYGAAWAYYKQSEVQISKQPDKGTKAYVWANKTIAFHFCEICGCCVCWWPTELFPPGYDEVGINTKMMDPEVVRGLNRKITYTYEGEDC